MLPGGTYNVNYQQDMAIVRTRLQWGLLIALLVFLFTLPLFASGYIVMFVNMMAIAVISVLGLNILTGYCGQISLGQAAFMAVGAYTSGILANKLGLSFWVCLPCGGLGAALVGMVFGLPSLRVKGFYLALATLAAQFIITWIVIHTPDLTGGAMGLVMPYPELGGIVFNSTKEMYFIIMPVTIIMIFFAKNIVRTRVGRGFIAVRDNDIAAEVLGINVFYYKVLAFFICSFFAGIAGSLLAYSVVFLSIEHFPLLDSIWYLGMIIVGGMGSTLGPILGTVFLRGIEQGVKTLVPLLPLGGGTMSGIIYGASIIMVYSLAIMLFLVFEPRGLAHRWEIFKNSYRVWPFLY